MKKELKRQIKQDELVSGFAHAANWVKTNAQEVKIGLLVAVVVAGAAFAIYSYRDRRGRAGEEAFAAALETFHAPIAGTPEATEKPGVTTYPSTADKLRKALPAFEEVSRRYVSLPVGRRARYYAALCRLDLGDLGQAQKDLADLAARKEGDALEPSLARVALAEAERRGGQLDKAIQSYRQMVEDQSFRLPHDHALMLLASTLEEAHRTSEASAAYKRLSEQFPASVYAGEARRRADYLATAQG